MTQKPKSGTLCVQGGWKPKKGESRVLPIYQSTTFKYDTSEQMARLFDLEDSGYFYSRLQNPTVDAVGAKINALEGGVGAVMTSSGQAARSFVPPTACSRWRRRAGCRRGTTCASGSRPTSSRRTARRDRSGCGATGRSRRATGRRSTARSSRRTASPTWCSAMNGRSCATGRWTRWR